MNGLFRFLNSSIGKKMAMGVTGLLLCGFLVAHLAGNLLLYKGPDAFNAYATAMRHNPVLIPMELGLLAIFVGHILLAVRVSFENRMARPAAYSLDRAVGGRTPASVAMLPTGVVVFVFILVHLYNFKYGDIRGDDIYTLVVETFQKPFWALFYVACMAVLALHLSHGFRSAFQSLGTIGGVLDRPMRRAGIVFAIAIAGGFVLFPLWGFFIR